MAVNGRVPILNRTDELRLLVDAVEAARLDGPVRILEAGCGNRWALDVSVPVHITGVDTDAEAMQIRRRDRGDLDEAIVADLRTVDLPDSVFDVAYCSYVLEHVEGAEAVLDKLVGALRPGGSLLMRVPDGESVFGFFAKHTPHRSHVWFKKYVQRYEHAGRPGYAPYPTVYDPVVSLSGIREWARSRGLEVRQEYASNAYMRSFRSAAPVVGALLQGVAWLSRGRLSADHNNIGFVMVKP